MHARDHEAQPHYKPLILIIVKRATILLFIICVISIFYWIVGSMSSFLDETQEMLLLIMRTCSLGMVVASGMGILLALVLAVLRRYPLKAGTLGYFLATAFGGIALVLAQSVIVLSRGLR